MPVKNKTLKKKDKISFFSKPTMVVGTLTMLGLTIAYYVWIRDEATAASTAAAAALLLMSLAGQEMFSYKVDKKPPTFLEKIEASSDSISIYPRMHFTGLPKDSLFREIIKNYRSYKAVDFWSDAMRPKECDPDFDAGKMYDPLHETWHSRAEDMDDEKHLHFHLVKKLSKKSVIDFHPEARESKKLLVSETLSCIFSNMEKFEKRHGFCVDGRTDCLIDRESREEATKLYDEYVKKIHFTKPA